MKLVFIATLILSGSLALAAGAPTECPMVEKQDTRGNITLLNPYQTTVTKHDKKMVQIDYTGDPGITFIKADAALFQKILTEAEAEEKLVYIGAVGPNPYGIADEPIPAPCIPKKPHVKTKKKK